MAGNEDAKSGLAAARLAYLYGADNGGRPVRDKATLLKISTVDRKTLNKHEARWRDEAEAAARSAVDNPLGFAVVSAEIEAHKADVAFLRRTADDLKSEIDGLEELNSTLHEMIDSFAGDMGFDEGDADKALALLTRYFETTMTRQKLTTQFLSVHKRWQDSTAISAALGAHGTLLKEQAKTRERLKRPDPDAHDPRRVAKAIDAPKSGVFRTSGEG